MTSKVHVAVGVVKNKDGQYLISKRLKHLHQGDLWEFPGGKVEDGESAYHALTRELKEELAIDVILAEPLVKVSHSYSDKQVLLDVWLVSDFSGIAKSQQNQLVEWVSYSELTNYTFPAANKAILTCLSVANFYAITGDFNDKAEFLVKLDHCLNLGIKLVQLRSKESSHVELVDLVKSAKVLCDRTKTKLIVNSGADFLEECDVDGIHLTSSRLMSYSSRPISSDKILAASVHNSKQLQHAMGIGVDIVVVSPLFKTTTHPQATPIGWTGLEQLVSLSNIPVFALGGMKSSYLDAAKETGAFGIASISAFWS